MTSIDPPARLLTVPTLRDVWEAVNMDRWVAIVALVCGTAFAIVTVWRLSVVMERGGDAAVFAAAIAAIVTAVSMAVARVKAAKAKGSGDAGDGSGV